MGISIAQLNMLSEHFGFDITQARQLLGLPVTTKCAAKSSTKSGGCSQNKPCAAPKKRGRTGYNLYCADAKARIETSLKSQKGVTKLARGELVSEMSKRWKQLPESTREMWNQRATTG
tara:strand:+ start:5205 stop:5558 length:354 start_codon:yes stop_codon:yes gene_type:complete